MRLPITDKETQALADAAYSLMMCLIDLSNGKADMTLDHLGYLRAMSEKLTKKIVDIQTAVAIRAEASNEKD